MKTLFSRSTGELIVIAIAVTVCVMILVGGIAAAVLELIDPDTDTTQIVAVLSDTINTLIGVMAGFLAGRTEGNTTQPTEPV